MQNNRHIVVIGATSLIAKECVRQWLKKSPYQVSLVVRNAEKGDRIVKDFQVRAPKSKIHLIVTNFLDPKSIQSTVDSIKTLGPIHKVLVAHGHLYDQIDCENSLDICYQSLLVNAVSPVLFAEAFAKIFAEQNYGHLAIIGSVAGDRGRKSNYVYGSSKGLIYRYVQGLQHRFAKTPIYASVIQPGPTDTPMTASLKAKGAKLAPVEKVALDIVNSLEAKKFKIYTPKIWRPIMFIIRCLPSFIFNRLNI